MQSINSGITDLDVARNAVKLVHENLCALELGKDFLEEMPEVCYVMLYDTIHKRIN